jgi:lipoate-protein ligase A
VKLPRLHCWRDPEFRSAAENMALDEALFLWSCRSGNAAARFYHWNHPAVTVGYFGHRPETTADPVVRRYTGGGLVEHGEDLTFVLAFPAGSPPALVPAMERYRWVHEALAGSLSADGFPVALADPTSSIAPGPCFEHPVPWDLLDPATGLKIGGGAQRRAKGAVIHQGSLRLPAGMRHPEASWLDRFLELLSDSVAPLAPGVREDLIQEAARLTQARYDHPGWNRPGSADGFCKESFPRPIDSAYTPES